MLDSAHLLNELGDDNSIFKIIQNIYNDCLEESHSHKNKGNLDNMQYCPMIAMNLCQFSELIPC